MIRLIIFAVTMLLLSSICNGQGKTTFGAGRSQDTSLTVAQLKLSAYGGSLDTMLLIVKPNGDIKKVSKTAFSSSLIPGFGLTQVGSVINVDTTIFAKIGGNALPFGMILGNTSTSLELIAYNDTRFLIEDNSIKVFNVDSFLVQDGGALRAGHLISDDGVKFSNYPSITMLGTDATGELIDNTASFNGKISYSDTLTSIATKTNITAPQGAVVFGSGVGLNYNAANLFWDNTNTRLGIGTNTPSYRFQVVQTSSASIQRGSQTELLAGYTGSGRTEAMVVLNNVSGTGQNLNTPAHNTGITVSCMATTTGYNMGFRAVASGSSTLNAASEGDATTSTTGVNMGGFFRAGQSSSANIGVMATLDLGATVPASVSTALHAGNGTTSSNIFTGYDNTTVAFALFDGGNVAIGNGNVNDGSRLHVNGTTKFTGTVNHPSGLAAWSGTAADLLVRNQSSLNYEKLTYLSGSATLNFPSTAAGTSSELTITVTGAADGDAVFLGVPNASTNANSCFTARVSATNTVVVKFNNYSAGAIDPASGTFKVKIIQ